MFLSPHYHATERDERRYLSDFTVERRPNAQVTNATLGWASRSSVLYLVVHSKESDYWRVVTLKRASETQWSSVECIELLSMDVYQVLPMSPEVDLDHVTSLSLVLLTKESSIYCPIAGGLHDMHEDEDAEEGSLGRVEMEVPSSVGSGLPSLTTTCKVTSRHPVDGAKPLQGKYQSNFDFFYAHFTLLALTQDELSFGMLEAYAHYTSWKAYRDGVSSSWLALLAEVWTKAVETSEGVAEEAKAYEYLAIVQHDRFKQSGDSVEIQNAVSSMRKATNLTPTSDPRVILRYCDLGDYFREHALHNGYTPLLLACYSYHQMAYDAARDLVVGADYLHRVATSLLDTYLASGESSHLELAIQAAQDAALRTSPSDPILPLPFFDLGCMLGDQFIYGEQMNDLSGAILLIKTGLDLVEQSGLAQRFPSMDHKLTELFATMQSSPQKTDDAEASIALYRRVAAHITPDSDAYLAQVLHGYGLLLSMSFRHTGKREHLEESIASFRRSASLTKGDDPALPEYLLGLGRALELKYTSTWELPHIEEASACFRRGSELAAENGGRYGLVQHLTAILGALSLRSHLTGEFPDTAKVLYAIDQYDEEDVEYGRFYQWKEREVWLHGSLEDVRWPVTLYEQSVRMRRPERQGHRDHGFRMNHKGNSYHLSFSEEGKVEFIQTAVESKRVAVSVCVDGLPSYPSYLMSLAGSLEARFQALGQSDDINEVIELRTQAIARVQGGHINRPSWLAQLGWSLELRFKKAKDPKDLDRAIDALATSVELIPDRHPAFVERHLRLGDYFMTRYELSPTAGDLKEAIDHYRTSAKCEHGFAAMRLPAARKWAECARRVDLQSSLEGFQKAIELISVYIGLEQTQEYRHQNISQISDLSRSAAAVALEAGEVFTALDWLEKGRCVAWNQLNGLRIPIDDLRSVDKELADKVEKAGKALEDPTQNRYMGLGGMEFRDGEEVRAPSYVQTTIEWKALVSKIREKIGFEDFTMATPVNMQDLPARGTVVVVNVHETSCDAIALRSGWIEPLHIPLPALSLSKTLKMVERLRSCLQKGGVYMRGGENDAVEMDGVRALAAYRRRPREHRVLDVLRDLWECVVQPVLEAIGCMSENSPLHRIWWCPTGPLAFLPLHAAGSFTGPQSAALDFVVSSYIPNVGALINTRKAGEYCTKSGEHSQLLVVTLPNTPDHTPLPGATREVEALRESLQVPQVHILHLEGERAVTSAVVSRMASYPSVHLACHAFQHPEEPLESGFFLHNGRLTLSEVVKQNIQGADLAYLSACQTSVGNEKLSEEAMHLAAGMLAAGYRGVVATMWSIKDRYAPDVAENFYSELSRINAREGRDVIGADNAAEALHFAVGQLRTELGDKEDALLTWVPYVHFGI